MQLNSYILTRHLSGITYKNLHSDPMTCPLSCIVDYDPCLPIDSESIYIVESQGLLPFPSPQIPYTMLCIGNIPAFLMNDPFCDLICCDSPCTKGSAHRSVYQIFQLYHHWEQDMLQLLLDKRSLNELCRISLPIFGNPLLLLGPNHEILGVGEIPGKYELNFEYREGDTDFLSAELIMELSTDPQYYKTFNYTSPQYYMDMEGRGCLYINIFLNGRYAARITSDFICRKMDESDWAPLAKLAEYTKKYLELYYVTSLDHLCALKSQLTEYLTTHTFSDYHALEYSLERIGWKFTDHYFCIYLRPGTHTILSKSIHHLSNIVSNNLQGCITLDIGEHLLVICNLGSLPFNREELTQNITFLVREQIMKAGFSTEFKDLLDLPAFYLQSKAALEIGSTLNRTSWIYHFSDYALQYLLNHGIHSLPPVALIPSALMKIITYDLAHGSSYYLTLSTYLRENMSAVRVTELLYIHRSTFKYRLKRLLDFLGDSVLDHPDTRLYYLNIFHLTDELWPQLLSDRLTRRPEDSPS